MLVHAFAFNSCMQLLLLNGASVKQYTWTKTMGKLVVVHCERSMSLSRWEKFMQERSGTAGLETFFAIGRQAMQNTSLGLYLFCGDVLSNIGCVLLESVTVTLSMMLPMPFPACINRCATLH